MKRLLRSLKKYPALYEFLRYDIYARIRSIDREHVFLKIYENNYWDGDSSISGPGSSLESTQAVRKALPNLLAKLGARSILDIPCGDFQWMKDVALGVEHYVGADIVLPLIQKNQEVFGDRGEFFRLDLLRDRLPHKRFLGRARKRPGEVPGCMVYRRLASLPLTIDDSSRTPAYQACLPATLNPLAGRNRP